MVKLHMCSPWGGYFASFDKTLISSCIQDYVVRETMLGLQHSENKYYHRPKILDRPTHR